MQKIIRIIIYLIVSLIFLNGILIIVIGIYKSVHAYSLVAQGRIEEKPGIHIAESLDSFLVAIFFMIFSIGISKLFLPKSNLFSGYDLPWLKIENFSHLKYILWEVLLTSLFVFFITVYRQIIHSHPFFIVTRADINVRRHMHHMRNIRHHFAEPVCTR